MSQDIASRVEAIERQIAALRAEIKADIKHAAHELRDNKEFIVPFWRDGADHASEHLFARAAKWFALLVLGALGGWLLIWAGASGAFKGLLS